MIGVTASISAVLLRGQLEYLTKAGFAPVLIASPGPEVEDLARREAIRFEPVAMEREISPFRDLLSLVRLIRKLFEVRPVIVNAGTPKAGLLCMAAAWICRVPVRIYTLRGFRFESESGFRRLLLVTIERMVCGMATQVVCISPSLRTVAVESGISASSKTIVLGRGSSNGIDLDRFSPERIAPADREKLRADLGLGEGNQVVGFVGRVSREKGIHELARAWADISRDYPSAKLLIIGPVEVELDSDHSGLDELRRDPSVVWIGFAGDVERYMSIMDLLVLPTYREGFGNVLIEGAAMRLPVISTMVTGARDAVVNGETGTLIPPRDSDALRQAIAAYLENPELRKRHGIAGREWVEANFRREVVWEAMVSLYGRLTTDSR